MAKQVGIHQLRGKVGQMKYYGMKGVEGGLVQSINEGMSERVKTDAAYANTRLNNAEFGAAGSTAGAIIRSLSQKWRYLLVPFATGKAAKDVRALMTLDATGKWGQRGLKGTDWQKVLADAISTYSKNSVDDFEGVNAVATFNSSTGMTVSIAGTEYKNDRLAALGITKAYITIIPFACHASAFDATAGKYAPAFVELGEGSTSDLEVGDTVENDVPMSSVKVTAQADNMLYGGLIVYLPYKRVGSETFIMQEHCAFQIVAAQPAA